MKENTKKIESISLLKTLWRLLGYFKYHRLKLTISILTGLGCAFAAAFIPGLMGMATDNIVDGSLGSLQNTIIYIIIAGFSFWICGALSELFLAEIGQDALYKMRTELFEHIQTFSLDFFDKQPIGELMSRVTNDTDVIEQFLSASFIQAVQSIMTIILVTIIMFVYNFQLTLIALLITCILLGFSAIMSKVSGPAFESLQNKMAEINGFAEERLAGQKTTIAYCQQSSSEKEFGKLSLKSCLIGMKAQFASLVNQPVANVCYDLQFTVLFVIGGWMVINGRLALGEVVAFAALAGVLWGPISQIFATYSQIISSIIGAGRVFQIMDQEPNVVDINNAPPMPAIEGTVNFENVNFSYTPGRAILKDNNFSIKPGQMVGLCGPTGAGKSTIINILTRYYDIESGKIKVDGCGVDEIQQDTLRIQIAQVLQEPFLFSDTIMNNLKYGREGATDVECIEAAKQANAHDFIMLQSNGYDTMLIDGGTDMSQGQRQMITIARAIIAKPRMLILDEATSNIDTRTEKLIQKGILKLQEGRTSFIIAHRLSTIRDADVILVIDKGEIVERGSHEELLENQGLYHQLYMNQFRGKLTSVTGVK